ncbi:MAG: bacteriohemerythrin [Alphaproteobacteria bacterium]|nr:bacteriohemerythrin [Alphaproteobacteria bacterium]
MGDFIWKPEYSVGDDHLDDQHKGLIELIDMLENESRMGEVLERLEVYVDEHFRDEERILENASYPDIVAHKQQHKAFEEWLAVSRRAFREPEVASMLRDSIRAYLKSWLVNHIMVSDKDYSSWLD